MLNRLGIETRLQLAITICVVALVLVTPIGSGGPAPVFFAYRTLLLVITILCAMGCRHQDQRISPVFLGLVGIYLALVLISVLRVPGSHFDGLHLWNRHALFISAFIALAYYSRYQSAKWKSLLLATVIACNIIHLVPDLVAGRRPVTSFSNNPNYFATFMLVGMAASLAVVIFGNRPIWRAAAAASCLLLLFGITQTFSRGGALAAVLVIGVAAFRGGNRVPRRVWLVVGLLTLIMIVAASPYLVHKFLDRGESDPYNYARAQVWINSLRIIAEKPLLGVGFSQYFHVSKRFGFPVEGVVARYLKRAQIAHSEYLQYLAENGIPAAGLLFSLFGYLIYLSWKRAETAWREYRYFHEAAILTAVALAAHALVDNCWTIPVMASGLITISLSDLLPFEKANNRKGPATGRKRFWLLASGFSLSILLAVFYVYSIVIPALGLYYNDLGHQAYERLDYDNAERYHLAAIRIIPDEPLFLDNLGMVYLQQFIQMKEPRLLDLARTYFARAIASAPYALDPHMHMETALVRAFTGDSQRDLALHKQLLENNTELLSIDPFIPFPRKNLAEALYHLGDRERAFRELRKAIEYEPNYVPGYLQFASWYQELGNATESQRYTNAAVAIVTKYREVHPQEPYEVILLARPEDSWKHTQAP